MRIEFTIFENSRNWSATAHQINSDILLRNVLVQGQVSDFDIGFTYDERQARGEIINRYQQVIGDFEVSF
ncbi:hypothetical protein RJD40_05315 [Vibrio scophthalmi]|uniref:hypothetical protein n=1 Tax=Vibrio scophthalmi TaxID=45658 RepID=UPI003AB0F84F